MATATEESKVRTLLKILILLKGESSMKNKIKMRMIEAATGVRRVFCGIPPLFWQLRLL